jgi:prepilin signal peptidase PulO-like enzyme (type II secretory pathway)
MIIPNEFSYPLIGLACMSLFVSLDPFMFTIPSMGALFAGPFVALPFVLFWFVSRGRWMGFADAKLALAMGWFLGVSSGFAAVLIAFWLGAIVSVIFLVFSKHVIKRGVMIPFAPFLLAGFLLTIVYNISIETLMLLFVFV